MHDSYIIVCDNNHKSYFLQTAKNKDLRFITSETEFEFLNIDEVVQYGRIIIFAEILWQGKKYNDFYGIDIAVLMRLKLKSLSPILIVSFLPKDYFGKDNKVKYNILNARGTCFLRLPITFNEADSMLSGIIPLLPATLTYLSTLLIDVRYLVNVLTHDLRLEADNDKIYLSLRKMEQLSATNIYPKLQKLSDTIILVHSERNESEFYTLKKELINTLNIYMQHTRKDTLPTNDKVKSKVLLLDGNINDLEWATNALQSYFKVYAFQNALEAKIWIEQDTNNELSAIICDWQLLNPDSHEHQDLLGFEVLDYASKKGLYALFSLTSTDDFSIREIDAQLNFEHQLFTKDFQQGEALWKMYIPIIQQKIDKNIALIASLPTGSRWKTAKDKKAKSFHEQYITIRNSTDWFSFENEISVEASKSWAYYEKFVNNRITSDKYIIISNTDLKNVLIARRIYLAYWFTCNANNSDKNRYIYQDFTGNSEPNEESIKQFVFRLCIKSELLPQGILPEEKTWLKSQNIYIATRNYYDYSLD